MNDNINTPVQRRQNVRRQEGIINNEFAAVRMSDFRDLRKIGKLQLRIRFHFQIDNLGIGTERSFKLIKIENFDTRSLNALGRQNIFKHA